MEGLVTLMAGIVCMLHGFNILFVRYYKISYFGHKIGPYPPFVGAIFVIIGAFFIYGGIKNIFRKRDKKP